MRREAARGDVLFKLGRLALGAAVAALPDAESEPAVAQALSEGAERAREALLACVERAAFALAMTGRTAAPAEAGLAVAPRGWPFGFGTFDAVFAAVSKALAEQVRENRIVLGSSELGALYEGMLATSVELARVPSAIVPEPRVAGSAPVDRLIDAERLTRAERKRATLIPAGRIALVQSVARRRSGSHYTPSLLAERVVEATLRPLLGADPAPHTVLSLRICDPSLGTGAFLLAACRYLSERLDAAEKRTGKRRGHARRRVAESCLFGVDRDRLAVETARHALWLEVAEPDCPLDFLDASLCVGDALVGPPLHGTAAGPLPSELASQGLDWESAFAPVVGAGGFDAFLGNPPWVSYAGRASQPLGDDLRAVYDRYEAFHGYKNLQGLFVERAVRLLKPGGRLGFVLPSSMSELAGYAPTRRAHDRYAEADHALPDLGAEAFAGVFQPCMVLVSTRRAEPLSAVATNVWPVERPDLDGPARELIAKLEREALPRHLFGERGLQSSGDDKRYLAPAADERHSVPLRAGGDIEAFALRTPSAHADPRWFGARLRPADEWRRVGFVVRQTARVPVAALSDGTAFRNSLLAGFEDGDYSAPFLVAYLNSTPIRWLHYVRHRDARQGMPQLKIAHLRVTPSPPSRALVAELAAFGAHLTSRGRGMRATEQVELDSLVEAAFDLSIEERRRLADFRGSVADARTRA